MRRARASDRIEVLRLVAEAVPVSIVVRRAMRRHHDLEELLASIDRMGSRPRRRSATDPARIARVARWCFRFEDRSCVGRALMTFVLLRRQGATPSFVSGMTRLADDDPRLDGHAWIEIDEQPIAASDVDAAERFREIFRYPRPTPGDRCRSTR